jgi:hypothetical protein
MKNLHFGQKIPHKVRAKKGMVYEEISAIKKSSTLHHDNRKDALSGLGSQ